ncbi:DNA repair protein RecN [Spirochaetia bacterium 38H-sp]|uniref:DNA repair protein RecN n=1 Tax=Rarispira pelagica TaxID=3141764 RepID=A0ABU9UE19_9SPIR
MLEQLSIRNYAIIDELVVDFFPGFTVITGETGAGKSVFIGALSVLVGERVASDVIRSGADFAEVSAVFNVANNNDALLWLSGRDIAFEDGLVIVRRVIKKTGRSSAFISGVSVSASDLAEFTSFLVDIHGQHEHQSLFKPDSQRRYLDSFAGLDDELARYSSLFNDFVSTKNRLDELVARGDNLEKERELLEFSVKEIEGASLVEGEDEELDRELAVLSNMEKIFSDLSDFFYLAGDDGHGVLPGLKRMLRLLDSVAGFDSSIKELYSRLESAFYEVEDVVEQLSSYRDGLSFSPERLEQCSERIAQIQKLKRKYGDSIPEILSYLENAQKRLEEVVSYDDDIMQLEKKVSELRRGVFEMAKQISALRNAAASDSSAKIEDIVKTLGMTKARFKIDVSPRISEKGVPLCNPSGMDTVEFLIAPNAGEDFKPLRKIASGGELSRVMLAIKTLMAKADSISTIIFDEVDTGIGGEVAIAVGKHLSELAKDKQVFCITHIASIASRADRHLFVSKRVESNATYTDISYIKKEEREKEIARMLSGDSENPVSLEHARALLERYQGVKGG